MAADRLAALDLSEAVGTQSRDSSRDAVVAPTGAERQRPTPTSGWAGHLPALDGVRGLAILLVLLYHFVGQTTATNGFEAVVKWICSYGSLGVDLFFVLSGFLITGILYDSRADPQYFRSFYMRRVLRIFPLYYGVLAVLFFVVPLIPALRGSEIAGLRDYQAWAWLYGINVYLAIHDGWVLSYIEHFWSLAVEEHFYFIWPLVVWLVAAKRRVLLIISLAAAAISFGGRVVASLLGASPIITTVLTPFQLDALLLGGFFAVYLRRPGGEAAARRAAAPMALVGGALLLLQFSLYHFTDVGVSTRTLRGGAFHILLTAVLLYALGAPTSSVSSRFFRSHPMIALGKYSYGLYVYHHFLSYYFTKHGTEFALASAIGSHTVAVAIQALGGMAASMAIAWLSYELFEKHFLKLKRFWPASRQALDEQRQGPSRVHGSLPEPIHSGR
jgi:peptidoglycan/LPS O-acetylase OafA/YrhL